MAVDLIVLGLVLESRGERHLRLDVDVADRRRLARNILRDALNLLSWPHHQLWLQLLFDPWLLLRNVHLTLDKSRKLDLALVVTLDQIVVRSDTSPVFFHATLLLCNS